MRNLSIVLLTLVMLASAAIANAAPIPRESALSTPVIK